MDIVDYQVIPAYLESTELLFELESVGAYENIMFPVNASTVDMTPEVKVHYDIEVEKNTQRSVDQGHSPWRLDAISTTQVFVSLQLSPTGIEGDNPIELKQLTLIHQNRDEAIVKVKDWHTNIRRVYLKKLIHPDDTGIWTVIGYDTKE